MEIMTGAIVPAGADAVAMVEHSRREGETVVLTEALAAGANIAAQGAEHKAGDELLGAGQRLDASRLALLAAVGCAEPLVYAPPRVAILATGDELAEPFAAGELGPAQIRNSNAPALAAQTARAGGLPVTLPTARDDPQELGRLIDRGLAEAEMLVLSGGVSKGKFDYVKEVLAERGAEIYFEGVRIRPGHPVVFARVRDRFVFGLPGNPLSAMLTFALFAKPAIQLLAGARAETVAQPFFAGELGFDYHGRALPLEFFLPVRWSGDLSRMRVLPVPYHGSADLAALAAADGYLVVPEGRSELPAGSIVDLLPK